MMCARACGPGDAQHNEQSISQMQVDFYCGNTLLHNPCLLFVQSACYENCSRSNVSYFMMVAHSDRGNVGGTAVEAEPSHQYPVTFCCCVTDGSRGTARQNAVSHGKEHEVKVGH